MLRSMISVWDDTFRNPWGLPYLTYMYTNRCSFQMNIFNSLQSANSANIYWTGIAKLICYLMQVDLVFMSFCTTNSFPLVEYSKSTSNLELPKTRNTHNHTGRKSTYTHMERESSFWSCYIAFIYFILEWVASMFLEMLCNLILFRQSC